MHGQQAADDAHGGRQPGPMPATPRTAPAASLQALRLHYPDAPAAEVLRFATARKTPKDALKLYRNYLKWRSDEGAPARLAERAAPVQQQAPQFATLGGRTRRGDQVVLVEGARYSTQIDKGAYVAQMCLPVSYTHLTLPTKA